MLSLKFKLIHPELKPTQVDTNPTHHDAFKLSQPWFTFLHTGWTCENGSIIISQNAQKTVIGNSSINAAIYMFDKLRGDTCQKYLHPILLSKMKKFRCDVT